MANTLKLGAGKWATGTDTVLAFNDENNNIKPLPFSFSRASSATVVNQSGLIETVGSGEPRVDFLGNTKGALLLEPQRTNLITYSEDFSNAYWVKDNSAVTSGFVSPDGTTSAYKLIENTSNTTHKSWAQETTLAVTYSFSLFAKAGERRRIGLRDNQIGNNAIFDLISGTVVSGSGSIVALTNGYYRISLTGTYAAAGTRHEIYILEDNATNVTTAYQGDGTSGLYIWGAQVEQGSYATSYIPTSGQSGGVTRVLDSCNQTVPDGVIGQTEGTMYVEYSALSNDLSYRSIGLNSGSALNRLLISFNNISNNINFLVQVGGVTQVSINYSGSDITSSLKLAFGYKENDFVAYVNGTQVGTDTSGSTYTSGTLTTFSFDNAANADRLFAKLKQAQLYNTRLSNAELASLTTI